MMDDEVSIIKRFVLGLSALGSLFLVADRAHTHGNNWPIILFFAILTVGLLDFVRRMDQVENAEEQSEVATQLVEVATQTSS